MLQSMLQIRVVLVRQSTQQPSSQLKSIMAILARHAPLREKKNSPLFVDRFSPSYQVPVYYRKIPGIALQLVEQNTRYRYATAKYQVYFQAKHTSTHNNTSAVQCNASARKKKRPLITTYACCTILLETRRDFAPTHYACCTVLFILRDM